MCGLSYEPDYTYDYSKIGLDISHVTVYKDGHFLKEYVKDDLIGFCCWNRPYSRKLTTDDIDDSKLTMSNTNNSHIALAVRSLIEDRKAYMEREMEREVEKAKNNNRSCCRIQ